MPFPIAIAAAAGVNALIPLVMEMFRDKPDPEAAKTLVRSKRDEMVARLIGEGMQQSAAEKQVDAEIQSAVEEADRQGQFNTPVGEMVAGAVLGGIGAGLAGKAVSKFAPKFASGTKVGRFMTGAKDPAAAADEAVAAVGKTKMPVKAGALDKTGASDDVAKPLAAPAAAPSNKPFPGRGQEVSDEIAAKLESRAAYDKKLASLDDRDPELIRLVDERVPAQRPGPFPEFMAGEMPGPRAPAASFRPWESTPEGEGMLIRKELRRLKADPRGVMATERSPFPDMPGDEMRARLYRNSGD